MCGQAPCVSWIPAGLSGVAAASSQANCIAENGEGSRVRPDASGIPRTTRRLSSTRALPRAIMRRTPIAGVGRSSGARAWPESRTLTRGR